MKKIDISIIIVSYNTKQLTKHCLETVYASLKVSKLFFEVIVVDNGSQDGSVEAIKKQFKDVILLTNQENVGFGKANNQGIQKAAGSVVLLLNSDTEVLDQAIEKLYTFYKQGRVKTIVGGKLFNPDHSPQDSCGPAYTLPVIFTALFFKGDHLHITRSSPDEITSVDWVMGACMLITKALFSEIGFFDENIFMYMEEIDLQKRAKEKGYQVVFYPDAHFIHIGSGSSKGRETPILNVFRGFLFYYKKYYPGWKQVILRVLLVLKSVLGVILFTILNKKNDQILYKKAFAIAIGKIV